MCENSLKPRFKLYFSWEHLQLLHQASGEYFKLHFYWGFLLWGFVLFCLFCKGMEGQ